ncbi:MAG: cytidine deaminase [Candidatus Eremiobacterota bacterium]
MNLAIDPRVNTQTAFSRGLTRACSTCGQHEPHESAVLSGQAPAPDAATVQRDFLGWLGRMERWVEAQPAASLPEMISLYSTLYQASESQGVAMSPAGAADVVKPPSPALTEQLKSFLPDRPFRISADHADELAQKLGISIEQLMVELIPLAKELARPPISEYLVGAVGRGKSGDLFLGVNMEYGKQSLNQTTHGEQFVVQNAQNAGETGLVSLAISAPPCGHCRQFLNELKGGLDLDILVPDMPRLKLRELLPHDFGPHHLGIEGGLLTPQKHDLRLDHPDEATSAALSAANESYVHHSKNPAGVAVVLKDGRIFTGAALDNAAYNPSLNPLQAALMGLVRAKVDYSAIQRVVLVEDANSKVSHDWATRGVIDSICPDARYDHVQAQRAQPAG